jgi:hypothetical protein
MLMVMGRQVLRRTLLSLGRSLFHSEHLYFCCRLRLHTHHHLFEGLTVTFFPKLGRTLSQIQQLKISYGPSFAKIVCILSKLPEQQGQLESLIVVQSYHLMVEKAALQLSYLGHHQVLHYQERA